MGERLGLGIVGWVSLATTLMWNKTVQCAIKLKSQATFTLYLDATNIQMSLLILCLNPGKIYDLHHTVLFRVIYNYV